MTFRSIPRPMLSSWSQRVVKAVCYWRYLPKLIYTECVLVFMFLLESVLVFCVVCYFFQLLIFLPFYSQKCGFPWLSMTHTSISGIPGLENEIINFLDLASFPHDQYEPCVCSMWLVHVDSMNLFYKFVSQREEIIVIMSDRPNNNNKKTNQ